MQYRFQALIWFFDCGKYETFSNNRGKIENDDTYIIYNNNNTM